MNAVEALDVALHQVATKERPLEGLAAVVELREHLDRIEGELVEIARAPKHPDWPSSWGREPRFSLREIAAALGRSKSSVHRQYGDSWAAAHESIRAAAQP